MAKVIVVLTLILWALLGCSDDSSQGYVYSEAPLIGINFASEERLVEHWQKHGRNPAEFNPPLTKEQYLQRAQSFFALSGGILTKERGNGDKLRYNPGTNEFGVLSGDNVIRTYFRPSSGMSYWERQ